MRITILTIFPEIMESYWHSPVIQRCIDKELLSLKTVDIKEYAKGSFRHIDDSPYGGGAGMILKCQPVIDALRENQHDNSHVIGLVPIGKPFTQKKAHELSGKEDLILISGHYEGMDARIYDECDELISVGDYILTGGEIPAMILVDSVARLLEGALRKESTEEESFEDGLLEYPQYTKPREFEDKKVPEVLLSGDHEKIRKWRLKQSLLITKNNRPDLFAKRKLKKEEEELINDK